MGAATTRSVFVLLVEMRCNSYCVFCGQRQVDAGLVKARRSLGLSTPPTNYGEMRGTYTLAAAVEALEQARAQGFTDVSLQGGEPTLFPELPPLVAAARALGFVHVGLVTNGRKLADPELARALVGAGLDAVTFSVLGHDAATHDAIAIAPGSFDELLHGLENARRSAREAERAVTINVNLIVTARTLPHLSAQVEALHAAGVDAASVHLVRFDGLASEEKVVEALRFDARAITPALAAGWRAADAVGLSLHATDVPLCLHPELRGTELELLARRAMVDRRHYRAAAFAYEAAPADRGAPACDGCVMAASCPRVPREYLPDDPRDALRPITPETLRRDVDDRLASLDPARGASVERVLDTARAVADLAVVAGDAADLAPVSARLDEALDDLAALAWARRDVETVARALAGRLGVAPAWTGEALMEACEADVAALARSVNAVGSPGSGARLSFAPGFEVALEDAVSTRDEARCSRARPILRAARDRADRLMIALFLACIGPALRRARAVRVTARSIDLDLGAGWGMAWSRARGSRARLVVPT